MELHRKHKALYYDESKSKWALREKKSITLKDECHALRCRGFVRSFIRPNGRLYFDRFCSKCRSRLNDANNRISRLYRNLKISAQRRNIPFSITKQEFALFCIETGYYERTGSRSICSTVDRKDNSLGYTYDNICLLSNNENAKKKDHSIEPEIEPLPDNEPF